MGLLNRRPSLFDDDLDAQQASPIKSKPSKSSVTFAHTAQEIARLTKQKVILVGDSVHISMKDTSFQGFVKLTPRATASWTKTLLKQKTTKLYLSINDAIFNNAPKSVRIAFALDAYLNWGFKTNGRIILIGGGESSAGTSLDILIFNNGELIAYDSRCLPSQDDPIYVDAVIALMDELKTHYPNASIAQAAPLKKFQSTDEVIEYVDGHIFKNLAYQPLNAHTNSLISGMALPAALIAAGSLFYVGALAKSWHDYRSAIAEYDAAAADPLITKHGAIDPNLIDALQQRRFFLADPRRQVALTERSKILIASISKIPNVRILELKMPAPSISGAPTSPGVPAAGDQNQPAENRRPDVSIKISVPRENVTALEQGRALGEMISRFTGMDVHMTRPGFTEDGNKRTYSMEGLING